MKHSAWWLTCVLLAVASSACRETSPVVNPALNVSEISFGDVPQFNSSSLVFFHNSASVNPEALLTEMIQAGIPVVRAWFPLDNRCMDAVGARFTVELSAFDARIRNFGFSPGQGRLECATKLKRYVIKG